MVDLAIFVHSEFDRLENHDFLLDHGLQQFLPAGLNRNVRGQFFSGDRVHLPLEVLERVTVIIPVLNRNNQLSGNVVWCEKTDRGYEIGIKFERSRDAYRLRMIEQICHIEHYRKEVERLEGRRLDSQQAAEEWIARYAKDFPEL